MIQGTTPTIALHLPLPVSTVAEAEFVLADYNGAILRKWMLSEMETDGTTLRIGLTQEETLQLDPTLHKCQLRIKTTEGKVMATKVMSLSVSDLISEEVI